MAPAGNSEMPNLFVIGATKCGTTSLHYYLGLHPEISMSKVKEPRYFTNHLPPTPHRNRIETRDEYLALFEPGKPVRGEASVAYTSLPKYPGVAERIAGEVPDAKLIYLVRDPIDRMMSGLRARIANGRLPNPTGDDRLDLETLFGDTGDPGNNAIARGRYMTQLREYLRFFPEQSLLVVDHDRLRKERPETLASIFEFVGIDPGYRDRRFEIERNSGRTTAGSALNFRIRNDPTLKRLSMMLPESLRQGAIENLKRFTGREIVIPPMEPGFRERLEAIFRPEVEGLREFSGLEFPGWSI